MKKNRIEAKRIEDKVVVVNNKNSFMKGIIGRLLPGLLVAAALIGAGYFLKNYLFGHDVKETNILVEAKFAPVAELATFEDSYTLVKTYEDSREVFGIDVPFTGNSIVVVGKGKIKVGFDLDNVKPQVREDKKEIFIDLPAPQVFDNYLEPIEHIEDNNILNPLSVEETNERFLAEKSVKLKEAIDKGIYEKATEKVKKIIRSVYADLSDYHVVINVQDYIKRTVPDEEAEEMIEDIS